MSLTLVADATTYTLPDDLLWGDEYEWLPTAQQSEVCLDGALIVEESAQLAGRPITLAGDVSYGWVDRVTLESLRTLASAARSTPMVLTLGDARTFNVLFRHGSSPAVEAAPIIPFAIAADTDSYRLTLRFMQVI